MSGISNVNSKGKILGGKGKPKQADGGMDLGRSATNKKAKWGLNPEPAHPHAGPVAKDK